MAKHYRVWLSGLYVTMSLLLSTLASCAPPLTTREKGMLAGGGLGAATATVLGAAVGIPPGTGAVVGGAVGAVGGALTGEQIAARDRKLEAQQRKVKRQRVEAGHPLLKRKKPPVVALDQAEKGGD